jgi:biopolymer transport protein ExbB
MHRTGTALVSAVVAASCSLTVDLNGLSGVPEDASTASGEDATGAPDASVDAPEVPRSGWQHRKALTVAPTKVLSTADLTAFPLLVSTTDVDLKTVENGGRLTSGLDLAFFAADGTTPLAFEIEQYSPTTGRLIAWVKLPVLSKTAGAKLYMSFGNPQVTTSLEDRRAVWSDGYAGVWHMSDEQWADSAGVNDGTPAGGATTTPEGMIGAGGTFGASGVYVDVGSGPPLRPTSITVSAWAKPASVGSAPDRHPYMIHQDSWRAAGSDPRGYYLEIYRTQTDPRPTFYTANGATSAHAFAQTAVVNGTWYYVVGTRNEATGQTRIYVNGVEEGSASMTGSIAYLDNVVRLGGIGNETWDGMLDEVRIARVARPTGWIRTEHENQRAPHEFVGVGPLEALAP